MLPHNLKNDTYTPTRTYKFIASLVYRLYKHFTKNIDNKRKQEQLCLLPPKVSPSHKEIKVFKSNATPIMTRLVKKKKKNSKKGAKEEKYVVISTISCVTAIRSI